MKVVSWLIAAAFVITLILIGLPRINFSPSPESYAGATATLWKAESIKTSDAIEAGARQTEIAHIAAMDQATQTAVAVQAQATATAAPFNVSTAQTTVATENSQRWAITVLQWGCFLALVILLLVLAVWGWIRAHTIPRDRTGQTPLVVNGNTLQDPQRMIGPALTVYNPTLADHVRNFIYGTPLPASKVTLSDGGADADHLLAAAQSANAVSATAALMRPGIASHDRSARLELTHKAASRDPWTGASSAPQTHVVVQGNDALEIIAQELGGKVPQQLFAPNLPPLLPPTEAELQQVEDDLNAEPGADLGAVGVDHEN